MLACQHNTQDMRAMFVASCGVILACALALVTADDNSSSVWPVGNPNRCLEMFAKTMQDIQRFEVFPGLGWDNLRNVEMSQVVDFTFNKCRLTDDGRYLIPDNVFTIPIKTSKVQVFAELIDQWKNTASLTSRSINVQAGLSFFSASISGKYSAENLELKSKQWHDQAVTTRVKLQYNRYQAKLQVDPQLSPQFKSRLMSLAARVELNHTEMAYYEAQLIVRDFGTHFLKSVTAGAALVKDDFIERVYASTHTTGTSGRSKLLAAASYNFFSLYGFRKGYSRVDGQSENAAYTGSLRDSTVQALGGPLIKAKNMTVDQWVDGVDTNLVPMDRAGDPLYFLITHQTLPDLPESTTVEVATHVRRAIEEYYDMNIIRGCTDRDSPQFSPFANFNDGSCEPAPKKVSFGGVYQTCTAYGTNRYRDPCDGLNQVNPKTGGHSCPTNFRKVLIYRGTKLGYTACRRRCQRCGKYLEKQCCSSSYFQGTAYYNTYWCAAEPNKQIDEGAGYHFGGIYSATTNNLLTGAMNCPKGFTARRMLADMFVCIGDSDGLEDLAAPFGGFFSCQRGNPLADPKKLPSRCPEGFSQHLATVTMGCAYHYCVESAMLNGAELPALKAPPFMMKPAVPMSEGDPMAENTTIVIDTDSQDWMMEMEADEFMDSPEFLASSAERSVGQTPGDQGGISPGAAAAIAIVCTLIAVVAALVGFVAFKRYQHTKRLEASGRSPEDAPAPKPGQRTASYF